MNNEHTLVTLGLTGFCVTGCLAAIFPVANLVMTVLVAAVAAGAGIGVIALLVLLVDLRRPVRLAERRTSEHITSGSP